MEELEKCEFCGGSAYMLCGECDGDQCDKCNDGCIDCPYCDGKGYK